MDAYGEFLAAVRRDINCLSDRDRMTKKNGLLRLDKAVRGQPDHLLVARLFTEELHKPLLSCFGDATEKVREVSLTLVTYLVLETKIVAGEALTDVLPLLLAALLGRFRVIPFPESSEELRFRFLEFLVDLTKLKGLDVARSGKLLLPNLLQNVQHQHWKVRKSSVECLASVIAASTENFALLEEVFPLLHQLLSDRHPAVRHALGNMLLQLIETGLSGRWAEERIDFETEEEQLMKFDRYEHRLLAMWRIALACLIDGLAGVDIPKIWLLELQST
eukprot:g5222.t1